MKYPSILLAIAALLLLAGLGIRMHAEDRYTDKMYYHTVAAGLDQFHDIFAERKIGRIVQVAGVILGSAAGVWFVVVAINRDRRRQS